MEHLPLASLKIYFCTLDSCVAHYLVAAEYASDCFDVIDRTEDIRAVGAYPSSLKVEFADAQHLSEHDVRDNDGAPLAYRDLVTVVSRIPTEEARVLWKKSS